MWKRVLLFFALATVVLGAQFTMPLEQKPPNLRNQPGCYISELGRVLPVGASAKSTRRGCITYTCEGASVTVTTGPKCGSMGSSRRMNMPCARC